MNQSKSVRILILGTRPFSEEIADLAQDSSDFEVSGFVENEDRARCADQLLGLPIHWFEDISELAISHKCLSGLTQRRRYVGEMDEINMQFARLIHPTARVSPRSTTGEGSIVSAGCLVGAQSTIGNHVLLNRACIVGHHAVIEDFANIMPGANIAGCTRIGQDAYIGMGAIVINSVKVGEGSIVGAGAVVTKDVPPFVQVVGNPARIVKELTI